MNQKQPVSYGLQLAILVGSLGIGMIVTAFIVGILGSVLLQIPLLQVAEAIKDPQYAGTARLLNTVAAFFAFFIPGIVVARVVSRQPFKQLGFTIKMNIKQVLLVVVITFTAMVLSGALGELNETIPLPADWYAAAKRLEETYKTTMMAMATMHSFSDYLVALLVIAVFPAIFEETLFRGGFQQIFTGATKRAWAGILITSILFSAIHFSYFGFLARVGLGIVLGLIFHYGKNIWLNILLHFLNNAFVVTQLYILTNQGKSIEKALDENVPIWWGVIAIAVLFVAFRFFRKESEKVLARSTSEVYPPAP